ncbi:ketoacyl-ACP synthase III family protein [Nocardia sp. NPDC052112]|uniref:ketoacyl-ACP synthase III family protein n=1 Tax=Nocardia sp. NPDC052112 TaxID=3155646 RepID=UPI0034490A77
MIPDNIFLRGIGTYRPEVVGIESAVAQGLFPADVDPSGRLGTMVSTDMSAPEMALVAARQALQRADATAEQVDLLLYADAYHAGPLGWLPQSYLQRKLVGGRAFAAGIRQGCNGVLGALELSAAYLRSSPDHAIALVAAADNFTTTELDRWRCGPHMLFADGASALVVGKQGFARIAAIGSLSLPEFEELHRGSEPLLPAGKHLDFAARQLEFEATDVGKDFGMGLVAAVPKLKEQLLDEAGIDTDRITRVFLQNATRVFVEDVLLNLLELPLSRSTWDFGRRIGHAGASDYAMAFDHVLETGQVGPGDHVLAFGVAPGFSLAGAVFEITDAPGWLN